MLPTFRKPAFKLKLYLELLNREKKHRLTFNFPGSCPSSTFFRGFCQRLFILFFLVACTTGCGLRNRFVYLNNKSAGFQTSLSSNSAVIRPGDRLEIKIAGLEPQSSLPFYFTTGTTQQASTDSPVNVYFVNSKGEISIPVLGFIPVAGLNLEAAEALICDKLKDVIKSPVVSVRIFNFIVSVLGEVKSPGYIKIINNRVNIFELIAMAGDISITGDRKSVTVWRKAGNELRPYEIDLTSTAVFQSPVFELQQNDVVYVKPNKTGLFQPTLFRSATPLALSAVSIILTTMLFFYR